MIRFLFFLISMCSFNLILAQHDSSYYGTRKYFTGIQLGSFSKTRNVLDSFSFAATQFQCEAGMLLRQQKILRPYGSIGFSYYSQNIGVFHFDSTLKLTTPSSIASAIIQPEIGFEISPEESWYFRLGMRMPLALTQKVSHNELLKHYGLLNGHDLYIQRYDFRLNVEVGKDLLHQRLDLHIALTYGLKPLITIATLDAAKIVGLQAGLRYHFGHLR